MFIGSGALITIQIPKLHRYISSGSANPMRAQWHFNVSVYFWPHFLCCLDEMAPLLRSDADYFRDKARRDLLTLLEGVRMNP